MQVNGETETICIIGSGTMGSGIARACLESGFRVLLADLTQEIVDKAIDSISKNFERKVDKGKITSDSRDSIISRLHRLEELESMDEASIVIEAISEDMTLKTMLYERIERVLPDDVILATNTSSLSVTELANRLSQKDRFIGIHFFNPADVMKLVEIVKGESTSKRTVSKAFSFSTSLGKIPVVTRDIPGFYVNRILFPMIVESISLLQSEKEDPVNIDKAMRAGAGLPMGPLELADLIGVDVVLKISESLFERTGDAKYKPPQTLRDMVEDGKLGKKSGCGFYNYEK